ncbi:MAG: hypothetical protein P1V97_09395 [Planctomycetota bacterium]|nr:hypothetical protein [Planctomycetota bacterium]
MAMKRRLLATLLGVVFSLITIFVVSAIFAYWSPDMDKEPVTHPAPHTLALVKGQTSLRLAMVHDVLHERYLVHSEAYWGARLKIAKATLDSANALKGAPSKDVLDAFDVCGVSLDKLHRSQEAVAVMRQKLALLKRENTQFKVDAKSIDGFTYEKLLEKLREAAPLTEIQKSFYRTYANLGTFLIHSSFKGLLAKSTDSRARIVEGIGYIKTAMYINPGAHFGRETWQYVAANHLLYCLDNEDQRLAFDINGNDLKQIALGGLTSDAIRLSRELERLAQHQESPENFPLSYDERLMIRFQIATVGKPRPLSKENVFIPESAPFDEPTLGIIGMWTLGGGANPHFSFALANNMFQVGQKYIAWTGYERTKRLAQRFWKEEKYHKALIDFCNKSQKTIEANIPEKGAELRAEFDAELAFGQKYQKDYQAYEERRLKEGLVPNSKGFYDDFFKGRASISSDVGEDDELSGMRPIKGGDPWLLIGTLLMGFGIGVYLAGVSR